MKRATVVARFYMGRKLTGHWRSGNWTRLKIQSYLPNLNYKAFNY